MSNIARMMQQATAGAAGAEALDVDEVFSTYLYDGTGAAQTITNDIDLSGEGGLVWLKERTSVGSLGWHSLFDTARGTAKYLSSNNTNAEASSSGVTAFNSNGFTLGDTGLVNQNTGDFVSWTFRKAPKFFDVVTWTGTGSAMTIDHNLGQVPGMIIVKSTSATYDWAVWHREFTGTTDYIKLNSTAAKTDSAGVFGNGGTYLTPTSTQFFVGGNNQVSGEVGGGYVAYLFAHNDGDGEFGPDGDADIIKCGSYTGNGSTDGPEIDLGFEPQWVLVKNVTTGNTNWILLDNMRGFPSPSSSSTTATLFPNLSNAEAFATRFFPTATGFKVDNTGSWVNKSGNTYIYMAIRRGPLAAPESATDVFAIDTQSQSSAPFAISNFPVDFAIRKDVDGSGTDGFTRLLQGTGLFLNTSAAEGSDNVAQFDYNNGYLDNTTQDSTRYNWMWKRAPSYFDVVAYTGDGSGVRTINHNLGVAPEMIWIKGRNATMSWIVYHASLGNDYVMRLEQTSAASSGSSLYWNNTDPTSSVWTINSNLNTSGRNYIAYLFASLDGISKVGNFSHTFGSDTNVDCGFSSGARFVLVKRYDASGGHWIVWDTARGIVAGNDPRLFLSSTAAQNTATDAIDPYSLGFTITGNWLATGDYIFYAIA